MNVSRKKSEKEIRRFREQVYPFIGKDNKVSMEIVVPKIWGMLARKGEYEIRQAWLIKKGWEPGWVFMNWHELAHQLQRDLSRTTIEELEQLIRET